MPDPYAKLARPLNAACPADYERAWIDATVGDDWDEQTVWCESAGDRIQPKLDPSASFHIGRTLRNLRDTMRHDGGKPWSRCTFTLFPDGTFKFDVGYGD